MSIATRFNSLFSRINPIESAKVNQGAIYIAATRTMGNEAGSGAGRGGGSGGSIREAGGAMGKKGAAQEEQYFSKQNRALKDKLKQHLEDEIKQHEAAIQATKELMTEMEKEKK